MPSPAGDGVAIVTGASSGIGEQLAGILSRRGYQVVVVARSADRLDALAGRLGPTSTPCRPTCSIEPRGQACRTASRRWA